MSGRKPFLPLPLLSCPDGHRGFTAGCWEQWSGLGTLTVACKHSLSDQARCSELSDLEKVAVKKESKTKIDSFSSASEK